MHFGGGGQRLLGGFALRAKALEGVSRVKHRWTAGVLMLCALLGFAPVAVWADNAASDNSGAVTAPASNGADEQAAEEPADKTETDAQATENGSDVSSAPTEAVSQSAEPRVLQENSLDAVYVSANGNDETGDGSQESPVASLAKAVEVVNDGGTVYVMSDLTMTKCARYYNKGITITSTESGPYTLKRGDDFAQQQDNARSTYNPAMIEVGGTNGEGSASLVLSNIVLDDAGIHEGEYFVQADSEGDGHTTVGSSEVQNTNIVQDGMIATYNGVGTITLGDGAILKNYGGMCAVRLSSGKLIMQDGSQIVDDHEIAREKGTKGSFGPAGAIWLQGGTLTMNGGVIGGAESTVMTGRAVYVDSGTANIGGTLQNLKGTDAAWQGQDGVAVHLRSHGEATLTTTGKITNVTGANSGNNSAIWTQFCNFTTKAGSVISEVDNFQLLHFDDLDNNNYSHEVYLDGTISNCASGAACLLRSWYGQITFGPNSVIEGCSSSSAGGLIYSNNGSHYTFAGTIRNNTAFKGIIYLANQGGGGVIATIEEGAHIVDNKGLGIRVNNSSNLIMNGGEIARNSSYGVQVSGKTDWRGVKFIMNGGTIADNGSYGIYHTVTGESLVEINGGTISGNQGSSGRQISSYGGYAVAEQGDEAGYEYTHVSAGTMGEPRTVYVSAGTVTLPEGYADVNLGRATDEAVDALKSGVNADWTAVGGNALWVQPSASEFSFEFDPLSTPKKTGLFVAYIQVNPDGTPVEGAKVTVEEVANVDNVPITLKGLTADAPYAVMLFNNAEYTITADSITKYIGGGAGDETTGNGFPELTINGSVDLRYTGDLTSLEIKGEPISATDDATMLDQLLDNIEAVYTYEGGTVAKDDSKSGEYTITLKWKNGLTNEDVRVNGNNVNLDGVGTLIVRHTDDTTHAQDGSITYPLLEQEPSAPLEHAEAVAKTGGWSGTTAPTFYTNNDESREVDAEGIQLLDDSLLTDLGDGRQELMEQKAADYLGNPGEGQVWRYDFHYLDLVDAYNGNAWVSASYGTTIYLPYPEGVTKDTAESLGVKVVHYPGLHREYGIAGQAEVEEALAACELETMNVEFTDAGIKFETERAGFSPFAIVWKNDAHTITASAGEGGTISPSGNVVVGEGADKTFVMTPDEGYTIDQVLVDGSAVELSGIVNEDGVGSYTFENIVGDHSIEVTFKKASQGGGNEGGDPGTGSTDKPKDDGLTATGDNSMVAVAGTFVAGLALVAGGYALSKKRS